MYLYELRQMGWARQGLEQAGRYFQTQAEIYPPQRHGPMVGGFKSERQRRFFFWALRTGLITVPYVRTYNLQRSWQTVMNETALKATIGSGVSYSQWTHGAKQAQYHKITGWRQLKTIAQDNDRVFYAFMIASARSFFGVS
jgi:hypothetical protein